jgi:hypothetical protein
VHQQAVTKIIQYKKKIKFWENTSSYRKSKHTGMDHEESQISRLNSKPRVHFGSLEGQETVKRLRTEEATTSSGGVDLDALGKLNK